MLPTLSAPIRLMMHFLVLLLLPFDGFGQHDCRSHKQGQRSAGAKGGGGDLFWPWDLLHTRIDLDLTIPGGIAASCSITATPRQGPTNVLPLHLLALTVDSVTSDAEQLPFTHVGELLEVDLQQTVVPGDTLVITVHYHGTPALDASGFGGFYLTSSYLYNLGVAFTSVPHSYGRAWFPCADNFTERCTFEFLVRTHAGRSAWCNGELMAEQQLGGDTLLRHWRIQETLPSYLASVAASDYAVVRDTLASISGTAVPVDLVARAPDTTSMKNSFINLPAAFDAFEHWFGPYRWNRVGYVVTPQGAMEHSTSIHYPRSIVNGNLLYEHIMAHELAHQWWGDLVTCERAEEMYINEGFAEYLSYLFLEWVYGPDRYARTVRSNHRKMVHRAHLVDQGWWALADVPQAWTYGEHSYNKGADVLHSLRGYLGDDHFREGLSSFLALHAFQPVNSVQLRDHLSATTSTDLTHFFNDWIFQPGWAAFEVDSFQVGAPLPGGGHQVTVHVQQKQRGPSQPYSQVPLTLSFIDEIGNRWDHPQPVLVGDPQCTVTGNPPFAPVQVILNADERISLAVTRDVDTLDATGIRNYGNADLRLTINSIPSPIVVHLEEYWVSADPEAEEGSAYAVSPDRWWRVVGHFPQGTDISGRITFDGRPTASGSLDVELMQDVGGVTFHEDSIVLLYRRDQHEPWGLHPDFSVNPLNNATDKFGRVDWNGLMPGEYTLGWRKSAVGTPDRSTHTGWSVYPNPAKDLLHVRTPSGVGRVGTLQIRDAGGRLVHEARPSKDLLVIDVTGWGQGHYHIHHLDEKGMRTLVDRFIVGP